MYRKMDLGMWREEVCGRLCPSIKRGEPAQDRNTSLRSSLHVMAGLGVCLHKEKGVQDYLCSSWNTIQERAQREEYLAQNQRSTGIAWKSAVKKTNVLKVFGSSGEQI